MNFEPNFWNIIISVIALFFVWIILWFFCIGLFIAIIPVSLYFSVLWLINPPGTEKKIYAIIDLYRFLKAQIFGMAEFSEYNSPFLELSYVIFIFLSIYYCRKTLRGELNHL